MADRFPTQSIAGRLFAAAALCVFPAVCLADIGAPRPKLETAMTVQTAHASHAVIAPITSMPLGRTYGEWSASWWKWFLPLPGNTTAFCDANQSGPVLFLAAVVTGTANCIVPHSKWIFFPVADSECSDLEVGDFHGGSPQERHACAAGWIADAKIGAISAEIDGVPVQNLTSYRAPSPDFAFTVRPDNLGGIPCASGKCRGHSSADGYYLMLQPLSPGNHTLHFAATGYGIDTTYNLTVQSEKNEDGDNDE